MAGFRRDGHIFIMLKNLLIIYSFPNFQILPIILPINSFIIPLILLRQ